MNHSKIHEINTSLSTHFVNTLRDERMEASQFRHMVKNLTLLLADAALNSSTLQPKIVPTWQGDNSFDYLDESSIVIVTVLRAGLPMLEAMMELFPEAQAGFLAIKRDETTHRSKLYYDRLPECRGKQIILVDPMIATGGSLIDAMEILKDHGASKIISLNIIGSPEGLKCVTDAYEELDIYIAQIDEGLNDDKYIIPGLGDAGDREYNTLLPFIL
ncbi:MAG: uracil phosphoribosyltransferase, partial [Campylobacterota bacterium]|nr:uracil phosphoribosyltransferase [Campylobacterota bacterium]